MSYPVERSPLFGIKSIHLLARVLQVRVSRLRNTEYLTKQYKEDNIFQKEKIRKTETPIRTMRVLHNRVQTLLSRIETADYLHSGTKGRSYITNASAHVGQVQNFQVDISKFYQSTTWHQVYLCFHMTFNCSKDVAGIMATLLTYKSHIPTGSPVSSLLSYFTHKPMFNRLYQEAALHKLTMTVLQDDISFSGTKVDLAFRNKVRTIVNAHRLKLKRSKQKFYHGGRAPKVTGIVLTDNGLKVPWSRHLELRKALDNFEAATSPSDIRATYQKAMGRLSEIERIQGKIFNLKKRLKAAYRVKTDSL